MQSFKLSASKFISTTVCLLVFLSNNIHAQRLSDYVNTLRGTNNDKGNYSRGGTQPLTTMPNGFAYWTPLTDAETYSWLYEYSDKAIQGFAVSHIPSVWITDYASFNIMPEIGVMQNNNKNRATGFSHANEVAKPYYYSVKLSNNIGVEMAPTTHACVMRFTYPQNDNSIVLFDTKDKATGSITVDKVANTISGYAYDVNIALFQTYPNIYFYIKVSKPIAQFGYPANSGVCAAVSFATKNNEQVTLNIGTSYISVAQAKANLEAEVGDKSFETVKEEGAQTWDSLLSKVAVAGGPDSNKVTFYSCLYKSFVYPTSFTETVNGQPKYFSPSDGQIHDGEFYTNNGFWDTYKTSWPLYNLLTPTFSGRMLQGFLNFYGTAGVIARWFGPGLNGSMLGTHSDILFADAYIKGVRNFDYQLAYQNMLQNATTPAGPPLTGRNDNTHAMYYGYTAIDNVTSAASWTLENSISDAAISRMAKALGKKDDSAYFSNRSLNYVNLFSQSVGGFFRGRRLSGNWRTSDADFKPNMWGFEYIEGNAWQYRIAPLHDGQGLADLFGSRSALSTAIDDVFKAPRNYLSGSYGGVIHEMKEGYDANMGQYVQANQTDHGMIYMYNYAGTPYKTAYTAKVIMDRLYSSGIGTGNGYPGDEDNGSMSAWYVFSALGFFPAGGAMPEYLIGSPMFFKSTITLENGKTFTVSAPHNSRRNIYVQSATLNGVNYTKNYITHDDILKGGKLVLNMGPNPTKWGTGANDVPTSITKGNTIYYKKDAAVNGVITASGQSGSDSVKNAFDDFADSKWGVKTNACWIQYKMPAAKVVNMYTITSSGTSTRDPKNWTLKGSNDGNTWTTLDTRSNEAFTWRQQLKNYSFTNSNAYSYYRLEVSANNGATATEIAEIELLSEVPLSNVPAAPIAVR